MAVSTTPGALPRKQPPGATQLPCSTGTMIRSPKVCFGSFARIATILQERSRSFQTRPRRLGRIAETRLRQTRILLTHATRSTILNPTKDFRG